MSEAAPQQEWQRRVEALSARNTKLAGLLQQSRAKLEEMSAELALLAEPASSYGVFLEYAGSASDGHRDAEVFANQRRMRVKVTSHVEPGSLKPGQLVRLGDGLVIVEGCAYESTGSLAHVVELIGTDRVIVMTAAGEEQVLRLAASLPAVKPGDTLLVDSRAGFALERVEKTEVSQLSLEEVPEVRFADIGGLDAQISQIRDSVELPFAHPELYRQFDLHPPKGVLLYGPPGCGKTLIAKAVANSLSTALGESGGTRGNTYFINVKGPELLNKYVGETERRIRLIFERARMLASQPGHRPVIIFFDEMESLFRTRGSGVSSDVETTVVPQLLTELDGVEDLRNVIVIGATNREELIDPAIMRPGRLDIKIRVSRPNYQAAREIFARHFAESVPHEGDYQSLINEATAELYADRPFVELHFADGGTRVLHYRDFVSGAMIANIVARAKKLAIKESLKRGHPARVTAANFVQAVAAEQAESEHIPTSTNPEEWAKIVGGAAGQRVSSVDYVGFRSHTWHV